MKIAILGGYGNTGRQIASLLAQNTTASIMILGRNLEKGKQFSTQLRQQFKNQITAHYADASKPKTLISLLNDVNLLVVASGTTDFTAEIASIAIDTKTDYFDINLSVKNKIAALSTLEQKITEHNRCFITDGGFHPGVPAVLVRFAASKVPNIEIANVGGSFQLDWKKIELSKNTMAEFITEILEFNNAAFVDGQWQNSWKNLKHFDFGAQGGNQKCVPFMLEEMRDLPDLYPTLKETGFYIAGFSPIVDQIVMPICYILAKIIPRKPAFVGQFFLSGLRRFASKKNWSTIQLEASGHDNGVPVRTTFKVSHIDPYGLTAIPVVAAIIQYMKGHKPAGVWKQAFFVDPQQFFADMQMMGVDFDSISYLSN